MQSALETGGIVCAVTFVQTRDDFVQALERGGIDLIVSDFALPAFDGYPLPRTGKVTKVGHSNEPTLRPAAFLGVAASHRAN